MHIIKRDIVQRNTKIIRCGVYRPLEVFRGYDKTERFPCPRLLPVFTYNLGNANNINSWENGEES